MSLILANEEGQDYIVNHTTKPFVIDILLNQTLIPPSQYVQPDIPEYQDLYYHTFNLRTNESVLQIEIKPDDDIDLELEVYVRFGKIPTLERFDMNFTLPNKMNDTNDTTLTNQQVELRHSVFIPVEYIRSRGIDDTYFMGIRPKRM